jgi:O-antigen/teichoic acid export membrane protein
LPVDADRVGTAGISHSTPLERAVLLFRSRLFQDAAGTVFLNTVAVVLGLVLALVISRLLGAAGYGAYSFAFAWATLLSVPAVLGLTPVLVRNVAAYAAHHRWGELKGILLRSNQVVLAMSLLLAGVAIVPGLLLLEPESPLRQPFFLGLALVPVLALATVRSSTLQGLGHVVLGRIPETIVAPAAFLALVLIADRALGSDFSASWAMGLQLLATVLAFALGVELLRRRLPGSTLTASPRFETRMWRRSAVPLVVVSGLAAVNVQLGTIVLGATADTAEVGVYGVAGRIAVFTGFLAAAALYALMPAVARLHALGDEARLRVLVPRTARVVLLVSSPAAFAFLAFPAFFLGFFGTDFIEGDSVLRILVLGEVIKLILGSGSMILAMTGLENQLLKGAAAGVATNILLLIALVPSFGAEGAALAQAVSGLISNALFAYLAWTRAGIYVPAISLRRHGA